MPTLSVERTDVNTDNEDEGNVDSKVFEEYFKNCVIPYLPEKSIIILDNATYHRHYLPETFKPKQSSRKELLLNYIKSKGEKNCENLLKPEISLKAKAYFRGTKIQIQEITEAYGHTVLYLPPYHPKLNPIEFA